MIPVGSVLRMKMYYRARGTKQSWSCRCLAYGSSETENVGFLKSLIYSGLNLNQDKATKPQTVQIVRQGEATPYWFKVNPLY